VVEYVSQRKVVAEGCDDQRQGRRCYGDKDGDSGATGRFAEVVVVANQRKDSGQQRVDAESQGEQK